MTMSVEKKGLGGAPLVAQVIGVGREAMETGQQDKHGKTGINLPVGFNTVWHPSHSLRQLFDCRLYRIGHKKNWDLLNPEEIEIG